ncbi:hypothetical protein GCM10010324_45160 [Streptomyces hiroshimensis]|uniref:Transposase n=1 Tax=Streptomyces hiroshimensis TaxID=66424 RepID=A0ABQ2YUT2_9ACTN|nr:hypothetical protein GCM10010324_45160 [Streptomyces hiroshimensis]
MPRFPPVTRTERLKGPPFLHVWLPAGCHWSSVPYENYRAAASDVQPAPNRSAWRTLWGPYRKRSRKARPDPCGGHSPICP